jgi:hypothetical protein
MAGTVPSRASALPHAALGSLAFSILIRRRRPLPAVHGDLGDVSSPSQSHCELPFQFLVDQFAVVATFLTPKDRHRGTLKWPVFDRDQRQLTQRVRASQRGLPMRVFILFSTTEGHARKLAQFAAGRLTKLGHRVCICDAAQPDESDLARFDAALLIASVHVGHYRR